MAILRAILRQPMGRTVGWPLSISRQAGNTGMAGQTAGCRRPNVIFGLESQLRFAWPVDHLTKQVTGQMAAAPVTGKVQPC